MTWGGQREAQSPDHHKFGPLCTHHGREYHHWQWGHQKRKCPWSTTLGAGGHWQQEIGTENASAWGFADQPCNVGRFSPRWSRYDLSQPIQS